MIQIFKISDNFWNSKKEVRLTSFDLMQNDLRLSLGSARHESLDQHAWHCPPSFGNHHLRDDQ